ncbi:MAG: STAS-like domain-containing protein [Synergistaceae bacterium]|jgi:hypothetical protein|nr:STAS-like domain-containing protein [Synergistaceae bacterium]
MNEKTIDVSKDFSQYPAGRYKSDGLYSGEAFREMISAALRENDRVTILLDNVTGFAASFLEEAFGGLLREGFTLEEINQKMRLKADGYNKVYIPKINLYLREAAN